MQIKTKIKLIISIGFFLIFGLFGFTKASQTQIDFSDKNNFNLEDEYNLKVDSNGGSLKKDQYVLDKINNLGGLDSDSFNSLIETDNHYIAVGQTSSNLTSLGGNANTGNLDFVIAKFNKTDLGLVSINNLGGLNYEWLTYVIETEDYYIAAGRSYSDLTSLGGNINSGVEDFVIARFNKNDLSLDEINNFGGLGSDGFNSLIETDNHYIAAGGSDSDLTSLGGNSNSGSGDFVIATINKNDLSLD
ncbi:MAG: hypothetical protein GF335_01995, partial [Candidatus Moranbacteria bacterium]|nr:hypothetical protein [Candidatus Moranbacteria bacterium]